MLFGGGSAASRFNDTWEYDGATWTQRAVSPAPPARTAFPLVFSGGTKVVLFGGSTGSTLLNDTWEYGP